MDPKVVWKVAPRVDPKVVWKAELRVVPRAARKVLPKVARAVPGVTQAELRAAGRHRIS